MSSPTDSARRTTLAVLRSAAEAAIANAEDLERIAAELRAIADALGADERPY